MKANFCDELVCETRDDEVRFSIDGVSTGWISRNDSFIERIDEDNLNPEFHAEHLKKEIQIRNVLDEGILLFKSHKCPKAIESFDRVLFYDPEYGEALLYKSYALRAQGHFVKSLKFYRRAVKSDESLGDAEYYRVLLGEANDERSAFPKIKLNIYAGDEHFARGEYQMAIESYDRALQNPSKFKQKILSRLLNKKASSYLELGDYENALDSFKMSLDAGKSDYALFGEGICEYHLDMDVNHEFRQCLKISKPLMLKQALALEDLGWHDESLRILDYLRCNHFRQDELYEKMMDAIAEPSGDIVSRL